MLVHLCKLIDVLREEPDPYFHDGSGDASGHGYNDSTGSGPGYATGRSSASTVPWVVNNGSGDGDTGWGRGERPDCGEGPQPW